MMKTFYEEIVIPKLWNPSEKNWPSADSYRKGYTYKKIDKAKIFKGIEDEPLPQLASQTGLSREQDEQIQIQLLSFLCEQVSFPALDRMLALFEFSCSLQPPVLSLALLSRIRLISEALIDYFFLDTLKNSSEGIRLRCRVSYFILQAGQYLFKKYGTGAETENKLLFHLGELLSHILTDEGTAVPDFQAYQSVHQKHKNFYFFHGCLVLMDYGKLLLLSQSDRSKSIPNLAAFTFTKTVQSDVVEQFLREHGIWPKSKWSILNGTRLGKLERIWREFYTDSEAAIQRALALLDTYHRVYRSDRHRRGKYGKCPNPDESQQERMIKDLSQKYGLEFSSQQLMVELNVIAKRLRDYHLYIDGQQLPRSPFPPSMERDPLDNFPDDSAPNTLDTMIQRDLVVLIEKHWESIDSFLNQELINALDLSIQRAFQEHLDYVRSQRYKSVVLYIQTGLRGLCCDNLSQQKVAQRLGIDYNKVNRYIYNKAYPELFNKARRLVIGDLLESILSKAEQDIDDPQQLASFDNLVEEVKAFLHQKKIFLAAEATLGDSRNRQMVSLYFQRLCLYLKKYSI